MVQGPSRPESVISLAKRRDFVFPCGEIYGGTHSAWDYGPPGVELKENIKEQWWQHMVRGHEDVVGLDSSVILPRGTWVASGHVRAFTDPLVESLHTRKCYRADQLIEEHAERKGLDPDIVALDMVPNPVAGQPGTWTESRSFSGLFKTYLDLVDNEAGLHYLRPEAAQGIFVNYANVAAASRKRPPFGIGQIGKSSRNKITPGDFIFRTRKFEQMELEFFCTPGTDEEWYQYWIDYRRDWYVGLGIDPDNLRFYEHPQEKLSRYSKRTIDIEYRFGFQGSEWDELEGIADHTDFDLFTHSEHSGLELDYFDQQNGERWTPYVIEPSADLMCSLMAFLIEAYHENETPNTKGGVDKRVVLRLNPRLSPIKVAVFPPSRKEQLTGPVKELAAQPRQIWSVKYGDAGAVGRRYRRQDGIGTPYCVTYDSDPVKNQVVTVRGRDTVAQERILFTEVKSWLIDKLGACQVVLESPTRGPVSPLEIGPLRIWSPVVLASMVGVTNAPFRRLCRELGEKGLPPRLAPGNPACKRETTPDVDALAGLHVMEMVTSRALVEGNRRTPDMARPDPSKRARSIQLYGVGPATVAKATEILIGCELVDHLDLNFGCPVPKVTRKDGGAALSWKKDLFDDLLHVVVAVAERAGSRIGREVPVTVKMRIGIDDEHITYLDAARTAVNRGVAAVALHARTQTQHYPGTAWWEAIVRPKDTISVPVLSNGDVFSDADAQQMMQETGCDAVVVGRRRQGRPWPFTDIVSILNAGPVFHDPGLGEIASIIEKHARWAVEDQGDEGRVMREMHKHLGWYLRGFSVGGTTQHALAMVSTPEELHELLHGLDLDREFPKAALGP